MKRPYHHQPAPVRDEQDALARAREIAGHLQVGAAERDLQRHYSLDALDAFSASGLWAVSVPAAYGGAGLSYAVLAQIFEHIAAADPSVAQLAQGHISVVAMLCMVGSEAQKQALLPAILAGIRIGNAGAELGVAPGGALQTRLYQEADGWRIRGRKFFTTGALLSHWVAVYALDPQERLHVCLVDREADGLRIEDDWDSFGQRTTASGTLHLDQVAVDAGRILPAWRAYAEGPMDGVTHITHAAIDSGIARAALDDAQAYLRQRYADDPQRVDAHILETLGELHIGLHAVQALLARAGTWLDQAVSEPGTTRNRQAAVAVFEAKVLAANLANRTSSVLFELCGARATLRVHNLDRHWRNARTHTVHDPVYLRQRDVGRYWLNEARQEAEE